MELNFTETEDKYEKIFQNQELVHLNYNQDPILAQKAELLDPI
jgi:hypothetical protein